MPDGFDWQQITTAQRLALDLHNGQPTAVVYRTIKGWHYGIEGRASHGAGHGLCSSGFFTALAPLVSERCGPRAVLRPARNAATAARTRRFVEACYWKSLEPHPSGASRAAPTDGGGAGRAIARRAKATEHARAQRQRRCAADRSRLRDGRGMNGQAPKELALEFRDTKTTLRDELGRVLNYYNDGPTAASSSPRPTCSDRPASTRWATIFRSGFYNRQTNPARAATRHRRNLRRRDHGDVVGHLGVWRPHRGGLVLRRLQCAARTHRSASPRDWQSGARHIEGGAYRPFFLVCAHAGLKTGEDGPTHADPQSLQLLQDNFPLGTMITLTPWDPQEIWFLVSAALAKRPAIIAPFVTRPAEMVLDRAALGLPPAALAGQGVYRLRSARGRSQGTIVLQGTGRDKCVS